MTENLVGMGGGDWAMTVEQRDNVIKRIKDDRNIPLPARAEQMAPSPRHLQFNQKFRFSYVNGGGARLYADSMEDICFEQRHNFENGNY